MPLEGVADARWQQFEAHLSKLRMGAGTQSLNILQLGDSHTAGVHFSGRLRQRLQSLYGDGGPGLLPPGVIKDHPTAQVKLSQSAQWVTQLERNYKTPKLPPVVVKGLGGFVGYAQTPYQTVSYELPPSARLGHLSVYYQSSNEMGAGRGFKVFRDGVEVAAQASSGAGRADYALAGHVDKLTLLARGGAGDPRFFGANIVGNQPGVVYSNLGVIGARLDVLQDWDSEITRAELQDYRPALLILAFGTNDVVNADFSAEKFEQTLTRTAAWVKKHTPKSAVLLILPPHAPRHGRETLANLETARHLMRRLAAGQRWRVWDWSAVSGRYCQGACPQEDNDAFFNVDGIHLTAKGYQISADALFSALTTPRR